MPWVLAAAAFTVFAWFAAPGLYWMDSQELGAAAVQLGVPHPTGFPLFCILGRALAWLPLGEEAFRVHLGSCLAAALCVGVVARFTLELAQGDRTAQIGGVAAAVVLGGAMTFFRQATVTEVYASTAAALAIGAYGLWLVWLGAAPRVGLALALFAGAAATGLHTSFRLLLLAPFLVVYGARAVRGARWPLAAPALVLVGALGTAAYLPVRSASGHAAALDWGHPRTAAATVDHLVAGRIRRAFAGQMLAGGMAGDAAERTEGDAGVLALLAAAGGALALAVRRGRRSALAVLLVVAAGDFAYAVYLNPMGIADRQTGTPLLVALAVLAGVGVASAARVAGRRLAPIAAGALAILIAVQPVLGGAGAKLAGRNADTLRLWAETALRSTPPNAVALLREDSTLSAFIWLTLVEKLRPDVAVLARQHLWDSERDRVVLGLKVPPADPVRAILGGPRPVVWELGDDPLPANVPIQMGVPLLHLGRGAPPPLPDVEKIFAGAAVDDEPGAAAAAKAFNNAAVELGSIGDKRRAAELAERAADLGGDPLALINAARFRLELDDDATARRHLMVATRVAPRNASVWGLFGTLEARAGHCGKAQVYLEQALAIDPSNAEAKVNLPKLAGCVEK